MIPTNTQAPADVEVAELVRWLRENADSAANADHHEPAGMLTFAANLLERPAKAPDVKKMVGPASAGWVLMPPSLESWSTVEEVGELVAALRQVSDGANACGDDGTSWITARAANLLEQRQAAPVPVAWMYRGEPDFDGEKWQEHWCVTLCQQIAEFKAQPDKPIPLFRAQAAPVPVPVCERDLDSILSPSGGYELREGAALTEGAQLIDGEWWAPVFGCDSVECTLNRIRQRLDPFQQNGKLKNYQAFPPLPVPVSERLPGPEDCDAEGRCWWEFEGSDEFGPSWTLMKMHGIPSDMTRWLPVCVNALPIPSGEVQP